MSKVTSIAPEKINLSKVSDALTEQNISFVLITCKDPSASGEMEVEMNYNGDRDLIACLIESASNHLN